MTAAHRFLKFWPQDWQRDPALGMCSLEARGLWVELLCHAHDAEPYGHVTVCGQAATIDQIGVIARCNPRRVPKLLAELEANGVFSRKPDGTIYSRRMVKDSEVSQAGREYVRRRYHKPEAGDGNAKNGLTPNSPPTTQESESESDSSIAAQAAPPDKLAPGRKKRAARLPDDWQPSDADRAYASDLGLDVDRVAADFRGYWLAKAGKDAAKLDWSLTWQGWCRRQADRLPPSQRKPNGGGMRANMGSML